MGSYARAPQGTAGLRLASGPAGEYNSLLALRGGRSLKSAHLADVFDAAVSRDPDRLFVVAGDRRHTYAQVSREADAFAASLADLGVEGGDTIAVNLPNWPEWLTTALAASRLGAVLVPVNPGLGHHELTYQLRHAEASVVVTAESHEGRDFVEMFDELIAELPDV